MKRELDHMSLGLHGAVDHKKKIGFKGQFYIEPKPKEPTKHQYDFDAATTLYFLQSYGLIDHFKLNLETNHAELAGHDMQHEVEVAIAAGKLGSIDANAGDKLLGWDVDLFPASRKLTTQIMRGVLKMGGFTTGGLNFDAKPRRGSFMPEDLFYAHIGGMDAFARGLKAASLMRRDGYFEEFVKNRYRSWDGGIGMTAELGDSVNFDGLEKYMLRKGGNADLNESGRQEMLENRFAQFVDRA
jgi:xylose isomerase